MDIPNTVLADIAAYFDLNENCYYRRVSQNWRLVLSKVFTTNPLSVSVTKLQHKHLLYAADGVYRSYRDHLPRIIESWFAVQKVENRGWGVLFYGIGQTFVGVPDAFGVMMKDCWLTGIDWIRLLPQEQLLIKTLLSIHITEMEHVNIGYMGKGYRNPMVQHFNYGLHLRKGRSAKVLGRVGAERLELDTMFHYYYLNEDYLTNFPRLMDDIIRTHEPEHGAAGLLPHALEYLYRNFIRIWKLKPLTERLLLALSTDCHSV